MKHLIIKTTKKREVVDITDTVNWELEENQRICHLTILHTTAALTTADLDPGTDQDMLDAWEAMVPKLNFRHPHDPEHAPDHILAATLGPTIVLPVKDREVVLGQWQRIVLVEFDGPRERTIVIY